MSHDIHFSIQLGVGYGGCLVLRVSLFSSVSILDFSIEINFICCLEPDGFACACIFIIKAINFFNESNNS